MNPKFNVFGCTLIVLAEHKPVVSVATYDNSKGVALVTASQRRNPPSCVDSKIHHNNLLNNIIPKIQVYLSGEGAAGFRPGWSGRTQQLNGNRSWLQARQTLPPPPRPTTRGVPTR